MPKFLSRLSILVLFLLAVPLARADEGDFPIKADDGSIIANHRMPAQIESALKKLPGVVVLGNPHGKVTLTEFYDLNCPYCRRASADIDRLMRNDPQLRLVLVPFPVLGIPSIQAGKVEMAVLKLASSEKFYEFYSQAMSSRGVMDGNRAFGIAQAIGLDTQKVAKLANQDALTDIMIAHVRLGNALGIAATPGFVIAGVVIVGYPGPQSLARVIAAAARCGKVVCSSNPR